MSTPTDKPSQAGRRQCRLRVTILGALIVLLAPALAARIDAANGPDQDAERRALAIKAAFLPKIAKYVTWPDRAFPDATTPIVIGVLGTDPFGPILDQSVKDVKVRGRTIELHRIPSLATATELPPDAEPIRDRMRRCHVLYICQTERKRVREIRGHLEGVCALTVSDLRGFASDGGMFQLIDGEDGLEFQVNLRSVQEADLRVGAQLMRLARKVYR